MLRGVVIAVAVAVAVAQEISINFFFSFGVGGGGGELYSGESRTHKLSRARVTGVSVVKGKLSREAHALASCENVKSVRLTFFKLNRQISKGCPLGRAMVDKGVTPANMVITSLHPSN